MERHLLLVSTRPISGADQTYNDWYNQIHLPEVLRVKGFEAAQRFCVSGIMIAGPEPTFPYLTIYEIMTDDIEGALADLRAAIPEMTISKALDQSEMRVVAFRSLSERVTVGGS